ncbi:MAG: DUF72 domain-containing protein [Candidatus Competibacteraceae bacterium]
MTRARYHLGCPVWSNRDWVGELFAPAAKPGDFLRQYSAVFDTVEGNSCFYGLPKPETVLRWRDEAAPGFRFCFKFPRVVSHERQLRGVAAETVEFLDRLTPLAEAGRLGPSFLQLPPRFGPDDLPVLRDYLTALPAGFQYSGRGAASCLFAKGEAERQLNRLLRTSIPDRVVAGQLAPCSTPTQPIWIPGPPRAGSRRALPVHAIKAWVHVRSSVTSAIPSPRRTGRICLAPWLDKIDLWLNEGREPWPCLHPHPQQSTGSCAWPAFAVSRVAADPPSRGGPAAALAGGGDGRRRLTVGRLGRNQA